MDETYDDDVQLFDFGVWRKRLPGSLISGRLLAVDKDQAHLLAVDHYRKTAGDVDIRDLEVRVKPF